MTKIGAQEKGNALKDVFHIIESIILENNLAMKNFDIIIGANKAIVVYDTNTKQTFLLLLIVRDVIKWSLSLSYPTQVEPLSVKALRATSH